MNPPNTIFLLAIMAVMGLFLSVIFGFLSDKIRQRDVIIQKQNESEITTRSVIAKRLHGEIGNDLLTIEGKVKEIQDVLRQFATQSADADDLRSDLQKTLNELQATQSRLKEIYESTYPRRLDISGLVATCTELINAQQIDFDGRINFEHQGNFEGIGIPILFNIYKIINLFVTNSVLHSQAESIMVSLRRTNEGIVLYLKDNGRGFDTKIVEETSRRRGFFDIQSSAFYLDKKYRYFSQVGKGTELELFVKL